MMERYTESRAALVASVLTALTEELPKAQPNLAGYVIGSSSRSSILVPQDLDLLFVDSSILEPKHQMQFLRLIDCLKAGDPFAGAFDVSRPEFRDLLTKIIQQVSTKLARDIHVDVSFLFGPTRGEINIPEGTLHIHVGGPLTVGDLDCLCSCLPFHAASFRRDSHLLFGPPLSSVIPQRLPTLEELKFWDTLLVRRIQNTPSIEGKRKWFIRMLLNRIEVSSYASINCKLIATCSHLASSANSEEIVEMISQLLNSTESI